MNLLLCLLNRHSWIPRWSRECGFWAECAVCGAKISRNENERAA